MPSKPPKRHRRRDRSAYWKRYAEENRERERARKRQWYLENREAVIARNQRNQKAATKAKPVYRVGIKRRYVFAEGRVYFNSRLGFTAAELRAITKELAASKRC